MEHAVQAWSPQLQKDILLLEKVQQRATRIIPELKDKDYTQRLKDLKLPSLEQRRARGDLIEVYKIMHGHENLNRKDFFQLTREDRPYFLRGNSLNIITKESNSSRRRHFFDIRTINAWNSLPEAIVSSSSINSFKNKLDLLITSRGGTILRA